MIIKGIASCLPSQKELNSEINWIPAPLKEKLIDTLGINQRFVAPSDRTLVDFAREACDHLISNLGADKSEIGVLVLVTQTADSKIPNSVIRLQAAIGIPSNALSVEINMGCSGFVQGLHIVQSLLQNSDKKYGVLVCGDLSSRLLEDQDTGTIPLFSDGVSATMISKEGPDANFYFNNSAINGDAIALRANENEEEFLKLNGHKILMMGLQSVVPDVRKVIDGLKSEEIDYYFFHQASKIINHTIRNKLGIAPEKCPETLGVYGNTSSATIPLTMSTVESLRNESRTVLMCGFGTGLSWATAVVRLEPIEYLGIIHR